MRLPERRDSGGIRRTGRLSLVCLDGFSD